MRGWQEWKGFRRSAPGRGVMEIRRRNGRTELVEYAERNLIDWRHHRPGSKAAQRDIVAFISLDARRPPRYDAGTGGGWQEWNGNAPAASEGPPRLEPTADIEIILAGRGLVPGIFKARDVRWHWRYQSHLPGTDWTGNTDIVAWRPAGPRPALQPDITRPKGQRPQ